MLHSFLPDGANSAPVPCFCILPFSLVSCWHSELLACIMYIKGICLMVLVTSMSFVWTVYIIWQIIAQLLKLERSLCGHIYMSFLHRRMQNMTSSCGVSFLLRLRSRKEKENLQMSMFEFFNGEWIMLKDIVDNN